MVGVFTCLQALFHPVYLIPFFQLCLFPFFSTVPIPCALPES